MECTRPDISERLTMALFPEDFSEEQQKIQEHVQNCSSCRKELEMMQSLREAIKDHQSDLVDSVSACPSSAEIVKFSSEESPDSPVKRHVEHCCECKEEVDLLKALHQEAPAADASSAPTAEEKLIVRNAVLKEYGKPPSESPSSASSWFRSLISVLHVPSMALGAVAAALLVAVLVPWSPKEAPSRLVLSDVRWESTSPQTMTKGGEVLGPVKKVAVIMLVQDAAGLSVKEAGTLYNKVDFPQRLGEQYELISPAEITKALGAKSGDVANVPEAARLVLGKTDADYVLAFSVGGSDSRISLACSLFERSRKKLLGFTSWDGIPKDRLPEKIVVIGIEMLSGAEQS